MSPRWEVPLFASIASGSMSMAMAFMLPALVASGAGHTITLLAGGTSLGFLVSLPLSLLVAPAVRAAVDVVLGRPSR